MVCISGMLIFPFNKLGLKLAMNSLGDACDTKVGEMTEISNSVMGESSKELKGRVSGTIEVESGGQFSQLPEDVVLNILSRLPVKDLKQCRYVKKSWYNTIPSPHFSKLHHEKSASRGTYLASYILQEFSRVPYDLYLLEFYYLTGTDTYAFDTIPIRSKFKDMDIEYEIVGSCNGLLCLCEPVLDDPVYICNPIIGEYITLPSSNDHTNGAIISGFGFDQISGDYKVIRLICHKVVLRDGEKHRDLEAEVYTLGSKNWRKIGVVPFLPRGDRHGVFLDGVIHWMSDACNIMCFDMASEIFSVIKIPSVYNNIEMASGSRNVDSLDVRVIKGHLCILDGNLHGVWVMKQYGDDQSWINECLFDDFLCEVRILSSVSRRSPRLHDLYPHVISFVSQISSEKAASGVEEDGCLKLEEWSKTLYPICVEEDSDSEDDDDDDSDSEDDDDDDSDSEDDEDEEEKEEKPFEIAEFLAVLNLVNL